MELERWLWALWRQGGGKCCAIALCTPGERVSVRQQRRDLDDIEGGIGTGQGIAVV